MHDLSVVLIYLYQVASYDLHTGALWKYYAILHLYNMEIMNLDLFHH